MRFASNLGIQISGAPRPDTTNAEGHPAFSENWKQSVARIAFTGVLGDQYYGREKEQANEFILLCQDAAIKDPRFLLNAALASRKANFKLFPKIAVAALIIGCPSKSFEKVEPDVVSLLSTYSAGQLLELVLVFKSKMMGKGLGSRAQRIIGKALVGRSEDVLENMTLSDKSDVRRLLRLLHPKNLIGAKANMMKFVLGDNPVAITDRQMAMDRLKDGFWDQAKTITDFKLPFNSVKGLANDNKATWEAIRDGMSPLQLLINLSALDKRRVMTPIVLNDLLAKVDLSKTRLVPHDILRPLGMAYEMSDSCKYREVLTNFLAKLVSVPVPNISDKKVGILLDFSGSMAPGYGQNVLGNWVLAVTLAVPIMAACPDRHLAFFGTSAYFEGQGRAFPYLKGCPTEAAFHNLLGLRPNSGTDIGCGINLFTSNNIELDALFLFTDEQQNLGDMALAWNKYRRNNPKAKLVVINVSNTKWHLSKENDPSISTIQSITPLIYQQFANFNTSLVEMIEGWHKTG